MWATFVRVDRDLMQIKSPLPGCESGAERSPPGGGGVRFHVRRISISDRVGRGPAAATRLIAPSPSIHLVSRARSEPPSVRRPSRPPPSAELGTNSSRM